jgi:hypothetical protein
MDMARVVAVALTAALGLSSAVAAAQERAGDAALGALSGALVGGPIGAVAGGVIGYTAGPNIARGWGLRHNRARHERSAAVNHNPAPKQESGETR